MTYALEFLNVSKKYILNNQLSGIRYLVPYLYRKVILGEKVKRGEDFWALKDVSFRLRKGETLGIIGPNGAGKSTILKLLARITYPTNGDIKVNGRLAALIELGAGFHEDLTGRENVFVNGAIMGMSKNEIKQELDGILDFAGIGSFIDTPIKRYSSGMKARLGFAVLAHLRLDILLVDEVLAVGDMSFQQKCFNKIHSFRKEGKTIIFISHNLRSVESLCQNTIWLADGKIVQYGKTKEVVSQYIDFTNKRIQGEENASLSESDRKGTGDVRITEVKLLDEKDRETGSFPMNGKMKIRIFYNAFKKIRKPDFGVSLWSDEGTRICTITTGQEMKNPPYIEGKGVAECEIYQLPFLPRMHYVRVAIYDENGMYPFDFISTAKTFTVSQEEDATQKYTYSPLQGVIQMKASWNFNDL